MTKRIAPRYPLDRFAAGGSLPVVRRTPGQSGTVVTDAQAVQIAVAAAAAGVSLVLVDDTDPPVGDLPGEHYTNHGPVTGAVGVVPADFMHVYRLTGNATFTLADGDGLNGWVENLIVDTSGHTCTVNGTVFTPDSEGVVDVVFKRYRGGWHLASRSSNADSGGGTGGSGEPGGGSGDLTVTAPTPVPSDSANTWTWEPTLGVRFNVDGDISDQDGTYSIGNVTKLSTCTAEALPGYTLSAPVSEQFQFHGAVVDFLTVAEADDPLDLWLFENAPGTAFVNHGSRGAVLTGDPTKYTLGTAGIGAGATAMSLAEGDNPALTLDQTTFRTMQAYTMEAEVVFVGNAGTSRNIIADPAATLGYDWFYHHFTYDLNVGYDQAANNFRLLSGQSADHSELDDTKVHLMVTYDGAHSKLYVNGNLTDTQAGDWIGAAGASTDTLLLNNGTRAMKVGVIGWYGTALSGARVLAHAQAVGCAA